MTVMISSRWRARLSLTLIGTVIAIAALYPRLQLLGADDGDGLTLFLHGAVYGVLVIVGGTQWHRLRWVAVAVLEYSTLVEGLQYFVPGREFYLSDLAANSLGVFADLAIVALWRSQQRVREPDDKVR